MNCEIQFTRTPTTRTVTLVYPTGDSIIYTNRATPSPEEPVEHVALPPIIEVLHNLSRLRQQHDRLLLTEVETEISKRTSPERAATCIAHLKLS